MALDRHVSISGTVALGSHVDQTDEELHALWNNSCLLVTIGGSGNAITGTVTPTLDAYAAGMGFIFIAGANNTGAVTINIDSRGEKDVRDADNAALASGAIVSGRMYLIRYDGTRFRLLSSTVTTADIAALTAAIAAKADINNPNFTGDNVRVPTAPDGDSSTKAVNTSHLQTAIAPMRRGLTSYLVGQTYIANAASGTVIGFTSDQTNVNTSRPGPIIFRCPTGASNAGPVSLVIDGGSEKALRNSLDLALSAGDLLPGAAYEAHYDGDTYRLARGQIGSDTPIAGNAWSVGGQEYRPGNNPWLFSTMLAGMPEVTFPFRLYETRDDTDGRIIPVAGAQTITTVGLFAVERGRFYKVRWAFRRRVDTIDPNNATVRLAIVWLNQAGVQLGTSVYVNLDDVSVGSGRVQRECVISTTDRAGVDLNPPSGAVYCRPFFQTFGSDTQTDLETMEWRDTTEMLFGVYPNLSNLESRVAAVESIDAGDRLDVLESALDAPDMQTYPTVAALQAAEPLASTTMVRTLGYYAAGDGGGCAYLYDPSGIPADHDAYVQSADEKVWVHADEKVGIRQLGVTLDGVTDETTGLVKWLTAAWFMGKVATAFASGIVMAHAASVEDGTKDLYVECGPSVLFKAITKTVRSETRPILNIDSNVGTEASRSRLIWRGGAFNNAGSAHGDPEGTPWDQGAGGARGGCIGFTRFRHVHYENMMFVGKAHYFSPTGTYDPAYVGGDQGVTLINVTSSLGINNVFLNQPDSGIYPRHNSPTAAAGWHRVIGCYFERCHEAIQAKFAGGRVDFAMNDVRDCRDAVRAWADYNPSENNGEAGASYQPYEVNCHDNRFHKISRYAFDGERVQRGSFSNNIIMDWGRRLDGEPDISEGRPYSSICRLHGCTDFSVKGNIFGLLDWEGGEHLEFYLGEGDAEGNGIGPSRVTDNITVEGNIGSARPYDYDAETGLGEKRAGTAGTDGIGMGVFGRVRGSSNNTHRFLFNDVPAGDIITQKYVFENSTQIIVETPTTGVASPLGTPWDGDMLGPWSAGLLRRTDRKLSAVGDSGGGEGDASPVRFEAADLSTGAGAWDIAKAFASFDVRSDDSSGAGAGVRGRMGGVMEGTSGGQTSLVFQTTELVSSGLTTRGRFLSSGWFVLSQPAGAKDPPNNGDLLFEVTSNTSVKVKLKGTDGTVRSVTLTLS